MLQVEAGGVPSIKEVLGRAAVRSTPGRQDCSLSRTDPAQLAAWQWLRWCTDRREPSFLRCRLGTAWGHVCRHPKPVTDSLRSGEAGFTAS